MDALGGFEADGSSNQRVHLQAAKTSHPAETCTKNVGDMVCLNLTDRRSRKRGVEYKAFGNHAAQVVFRQPNSAAVVFLGPVDRTLTP